MIIPLTLAIILAHITCSLAEEDTALLKTDNLHKIADASNRVKLAQIWLSAYHRKASRLFTEAAKDYLSICRQIQVQYSKFMNTYELVLTQNDLQERNTKMYYEILKSAKLVGITTTGAAIHQNLLLAVKPAVIIVEEACEILEANLLATLTPSVKHLIMIGDHMQLKPKALTLFLKL